MWTLAATIIDWIQPLANFLLEWAGWIVAVLSLGVAWWYAKRSSQAAERSARAAEKSTSIAQEAMKANQQSASAAQASAQVARESLEYGREIEDQRARATVSSLALRVEAQAARTRRQSERLLRLAGDAAGHFGRSTLLDRKKEELASLADEIDEHAELGKSLDVESDDLTRFSREELARVEAKLRADLTWLELQTESLSGESREYERQILAERSLKALRDLSKTDIRR